MRVFAVLLLALTLVCAVGAASSSALILRLALALGAAAIAATVVNTVVADADLALSHIIGAVLIAAAPAALAGGVIAEVRAYGVTLRAVAGALAIYLLLGMLFAQVIGSVASLDEAQYFGTRGDGTVAEHLYFSYVTLATLGYGDFTPATGLGRSLAMLEGVLGQIYLVTIVSMLIGNVRRPGDRAQAPEGQ